MLTLGNTVVHPHHGPAVVTGHITRTLGGKLVKYAELLVNGNQLNIAVPLSRVDEVGLRELATESQLDRLLKVLVADTGKESRTWSRRMKSHQAKLRSGDPLQAAEVTRDVIRRREERGISLAEKELLRETMELLATEVSLVMDISEEEAEELITQLVVTQDLKVAKERVAA